MFTPTAFLNSAEQEPNVLKPVVAGAGRFDSSSDEIAMASTDGSAVHTTPSDSSFSLPPESCRPSSETVNHFGIDPYALRTGCAPRRFSWSRS